MNRIRVFVFGLIALVGVEAAVVALDAALPPNLVRAQRSSPVALDREGAWLLALPVDRGRWRIRADLARTDPDVPASRGARSRMRTANEPPGVDPMAVLGRAMGAAAA